MNIGDTIVIGKFSNITILGEHMHINELNIENIGCIKKLDLKFNDKFNVICGANGIGKTTILNVLSDQFSIGNTELTRNATAQYGQYQIHFAHKEKIIVCNSTIKKFNPRDPYTSPIPTYSLYLMRIGTARNIPYTQTPSITPDPDRSNHSTGFINQSGIDSENLKAWFINRFAFHDKTGSLSQEEKDNYELSKSVFGILDKSINFKTVLAKTFDIILSTPNGDIYFEYLSSGYKSCIFIIMNLIKEIEFRFSKNPIRVKDFDGCVLIDEIEEHLHPTWQAQLVNALKEIFPKTQFIVTTHSPSILQTLDKNEIIPLYLDETNQTAIKPLNLGDYGLQGWTLEEILKDVMGMPSTTSTLYSSTMEKFNKAMNEEDQEEILKQYHLLLQMLHPNNPLRRLLQIQVAEWEE